MNRVEGWAGRLGRPLRVALRALALLLLLGLGAELVAFATFSLHGLWVGRAAWDENPLLRSEVYREAEWARDYFGEFDASFETAYYPYTGYRRVPNFRGRYIDLDERALRRTTPDCGSDALEALEVFFFGGSAAWGTGARDEGTIPSQLARLLCRAGIAARVTNFAESGYTSTQGLLMLLMELQADRVPDVVVFYDGVNDVFSSYQNGAPGLPQNVANRRAAYRLSRGAFLTNLAGLARATHAGRLAMTFVKRSMPGDGERGRRGPEDETALVDATVALYRRNVEIVEVLAERYGFRALFYWQPSLCTKDVLSDDERARIEVDPGYQRLYRAASARARRLGAVADLSDVFDPFERTFFIDEYHVSEEGNAVVGSRIFEDVARGLAGDGPAGTPAAL